VHIKLSQVQLRLKNKYLKHFEGKNPFDKKYGKISNNERHNFKYNNFVCSHNITLLQSEYCNRNKLKLPNSSVQ
jgi:hypothetical protein